MKLAQRCINLFLYCYKNINRTGIFNYSWMQSLFIISYFNYKKHIEDPNAKLIKFYPELFKNGHILDIGANVGYTSHIFSQTLTPSCKVFSFEPEKRNAKILKKAADKYGFSDRTLIVEAAVGDKEGEIELWQNDSHHADHRVLTDELRKQLNTNIQIQKIPMITIDHFLRTKNILTPIAFIKIDVQGFELAVCRGMQNTLAANPNCVIEFEYCPNIMNELGYCSEELISFFIERNYFLYRINKNGSLVPFAPIENKISNTTEYLDILCSKKELIAQ